MQIYGDLANTEAAAEAERARRQAQVAFNDLSTASTRDSDAYMAQTDSRGRAIHSNPAHDARVAAQVQQRQAQLQASGNSATAAWNNPNAIPGTNPNDLNDVFGGQAHRQQFTHTPGRVSAGTAAIPRTRAGPRPAPTTGNGPAGRVPTAPAVMTRTGAGSRPAATMVNRRAGQIPTGTAAMLRARAGPGPAVIKAERRTAILGNRIAVTQTNSSNRQRASSPTAHGTVRDVGGRRQAVPLPRRHRGPARDGSFEGPVPTAPRIPFREPVLDFPQSPRLIPELPTLQVPQAPRLDPVQPALQVLQTPLTPTEPDLQAPQAPRLAPVQPALEVLQAPLTPAQPDVQVSQAPRLAPVQPVLQVSQVPQASDWPDPLNINKAPRQPASLTSQDTVQPASLTSQDTVQPASVTSQDTIQPVIDCRSSREKEVEKQKVSMILGALGTHRLLSLLNPLYEDGLNIKRTKLQVCVCAVNTSEPSELIKGKGEEWVLIFHALRKDFISRAIEIAYMTADDQEKQYQNSWEKYFDFEKLFWNIFEARAIVQDSLQYDQDIQEEWVSEGKKDVLDRVVEKEAALDAEMELETTIQQTYERLNPQAPAAQATGVFTSITGPLTGDLPVRYGVALNGVFQACCPARQASLMHQLDSSYSSDEEL